MPHFCGSFALPKFLETYLASRRLRGEEVHDIAKLILDYVAQLDQMLAGCWYSGRIEEGYDWTVWQVIINGRLLGLGFHILLEDWHTIMEMLLVRGIDTPFCLEVHHLGHAPPLPPPPGPGPPPGGDPCQHPLALRQKRRAVCQPTYVGRYELAPLDPCSGTYDGTEIGSNFALTLSKVYEG